MALHGGNDDVLRPEIPGVVARDRAAFETATAGREDGQAARAHGREMRAAGEHRYLVAAVGEQITRNHAADGPGAGNADFHACLPCVALPSSGAVAPRKNVIRE